MTSGPAELIWAACDFDGTIAQSVWPDPGIGEPVRFARAKLLELRSRGYKIVIYTARGWEHYMSIETWLNEHDMPYDKIVCGKLLARVYIDDRAVQATEACWLPEYHGI